MDRLGVFYAPISDADPKGIEARIRMRRGYDPRTVKGESIEVRETGFLVLSAATSELLLLPYYRMASMRFAYKVGVSRSVAGSSVEVLDIHPMWLDRQRQRVFALFSRYPFGLDDSHLRSLLKVLGQSEIVVVGS